MVAMLQRLDAGSLFFRSQLIVAGFLPLFFKIFWNCLSSHACQCDRPIPLNSVLFCPLGDDPIATNQRMARQPLTGGR